MIHYRLLLTVALAATSIARRLGLLETGGSDFHGQPRGTDLGDLDVPLSVLERLKGTAGISG